MQVLAQSRLDKADIQRGRCEVDEGDLGGVDQRVSVLVPELEIAFGSRFRVRFDGVRRVV